MLNGIKTFGNEHIDDAILDATALMCAAGGPLSDLFDQIVKSRKDQLPRASQITYEDGRGVSGWVNGRRLLVGNRELLRAHGIEPPSRDYEQKYLLGGRQIAYLASGGELVALFLVSYHSDKRRTLELQRVESHGISLLVATCDPNITPQFLADCFRIDARSVRVLPDRQGSAYRRMVKNPRPRRTRCSSQRAAPPPCCGCSRRACACAGACRSRWGSRLRRRPSGSRSSRSSPAAPASASSAPPRCSSTSCSGR